MSKKIRKKKKAFTLIELVIVLAVLAIIALIAIPNFNKVRTDSQIKADERTMDVIKRVVTMEIANQNIDEESATELTITFADDGTKTVEVNGTNSDEDKVEESLSEVSAPQQKGGIGYKATIANGEVTKVEVTKVKNPA